MLKNCRQSLLNGQDFETTRLRQAQPDNFYNLQFSWLQAQLPITFLSPHFSLQLLLKASILINH